MTDEQFKPPVIDPKKLKRGDRLTVVVLGPGDDLTNRMPSLYPADVMVVAFDPAPPILEPRCEVEFDHPDTPNKRMVGDVIAVHGGFAWVEHRLGGQGIYPCEMLKVIREAKK